MSEFLASNDWKWRLARTIVQGVLGVFVANVDLILGYAILDPTLRRWSWRSRWRCCRR